MTMALVSTMTEREFGVVFTKLAIQLRWVDADVVAIKSYYEALRELPLAAIDGAAQQFAREAGRKWFPTSAEWHEVATVHATQVLREALPHRAEPWRHECERCEDTGFVLGLECSGDATCGRPKKHQPHSYTRVCPCRPTNRTWARHQKFGSGE